MNEWMNEWTTVLNKETITTYVGTVYIYIYIYIYANYYLISSFVYSIICVVTFIILDIELHKVKQKSKQ
jgi:hypothetical protein